MTLAYEQVKAITFGAVNVKSESDGIHFLKCTDAQIAAWYALRTDLGERAETTTGVTIDFYTDSKHVAFSVIGDKFELLVNGILTRQIKGDGPQSELEVLVDCQEGVNRITLVFPSHGKGILQSIVIDDNAYIKPHVFDKKILFIGDSITQGWDSHFDCMSFAHKVAAFYNADRIINGIGGAVYHVSTFDKPDFDADMIVAAYGTNDFSFYSTYEQYKEQVSAYLQKVKEAYSEKQIFVVTPIWRSDDQKVTPVGTFEKCRETIKAECERLGLIDVDGYQLVPHFEEFYADAVHPNDLGFAMYAENLITEINKYLV